MALVISPSDGFISRLLKQGQHDVPGAQEAAGKPARQDQLSISSQARQAMQTTGDKSPESRLIDLYNQKGKSAA